MLNDWRIPLAKVHVILADNMKKAMKGVSVLSWDCFAATLQLVVHKGLISQHSVRDTIAKITGHFKHSQLEDIQTELKVPTNHLH